MRFPVGGSRCLRCLLTLRFSRFLQISNTPSVLKSKKMSNFIVDPETSVVSLDVKSAFQELSEREKIYAHYLSRASFYGGLIILLQTSKESPQIYRLITRINKSQDLNSLKKAALEVGLTEEEFHSYALYCCGIYYYCGNYKGFGDTKIIPNLPLEKFYGLIKASKAYETQAEELNKIWNSIKEDMYLLDDKTKQFGFEGKGITKYLGKGIESKDGEIVNKFIKEQKMDLYNTRLFKRTDESGKVVYEIRCAAVDSSTIKEVEFMGCKFILTSGDYSRLLEKVNENLTLAAKHCANENEKLMIQYYMESFKTGDLEAHKEGSRMWIKDKGPVIETNIGFIENYRDPLGLRAEFEGFVAVVNKIQSAKFQELVNQAEKFISLLPWGSGFEKDTFLKPDFTSLDVLTFASSEIPIGINIPNYDMIRQSEGFKNVYLANVAGARYKIAKPANFISEEDDKTIKEFVASALEVHVGLHELLGHGSGKLLYRQEDGSFNFSPDLINPLSGTKVDKFYEPGESYDSKFTSLSSSYEECRAECVGLYLSCDHDVLRIFAADNPKVTYAVWLRLCVSALTGMEAFTPTTKEWKQAHSQARFVILQVLLQKGEGFISVKEVVGEDGKPDLLLTMDNSKLESIGKKAIGDFLQKLNIYKSTGDIENAKKMYDGYSSLDSEDSLPWLKWRNIIMERRKPITFNIQSNTFIKDEKLVLVEYEENKEGLIKSNVDRFSSEDHLVIDKWLLELYEKDLKDFD